MGPLDLCALCSLSDRPIRTNWRAPPQAERNSDQQDSQEGLVEVLGLVVRPLGQVTFPL